MSNDTHSMTAAADDAVADTMSHADAGRISGGRNVTVMRVFDAPRELVFQAWTDPEHLARWYAPEGCTIVFHALDLRPGGTFHHTIFNPQFHDCTCAGIYREIVVPERIVYTQFFADREGRFLSPADADMAADWPEEATVTVTFTEHEGKTTMTLEQTVPDALAMRTGAFAGWISMFDRLAGLVERA